MAQITCQDLSLGYESKTIISGLNFSVDCGDYLCIVGDGLKPKEIGYLPQQTVVQRDFPASVEEIVLSGCLNRCGLRPYYTCSEKQLAKDNMEKMRISHLSKHCYRQLSGGQQQRVLLARALCATRKMLLLDEPVSGLDPQATIEMYEIISEINKERGITIIMISHDINSAVKYASHILHVGNPLFFGTQEQYLNLRGGTFSSSPFGGND
jgi:zinc transport system ATP-binding protein